MIFCHNYFHLDIQIYSHKVKHNSGYYLKAQPKLLLLISYCKNKKLWNFESSNFSFAFLPLKLRNFEWLEVYNQLIVQQFSQSTSKWEVHIPYNCIWQVLKLGWWDECYPRSSIYQMVIWSGNHLHLLNTRLYENFKLLWLKILT